MKSEIFKINNIPAVIYGDKSDKCYLFIHGKCGCKEEAYDFADYACKKGYQVIGIDLPGHGERKNEIENFDPWHAVPELKSVLKYIRDNYKTVALRANSIGAWFSILAFEDFQFEKVLFVSPLLSMKKLIENMMTWASVTETQLAQQKIIPTDFGETLSWDYYQYAKNNPITKWDSETYILYAEKDNLTDIETVNEFCNKFGCNLSVMENGEHWFHTKEQLEVLNSWTEKLI